MTHGSEATIYEDGDTAVEIKETIHAGKVFSTFKRYTQRIKVNSKKEETTQYLIFSDMIDQKYHAGTLTIRDNDPLTKPSFVIEHPKTDKDGTYFIVMSYTEVVQ